MLDRRLTAWTPRVTGESFKIPPLPKVDNETIYDESLHDITDAHKSAAEEVQQIHRGVMTECYQWESDVSSSKYSTLLKLKHPHIIEIDDGEWSPSLCILRVTKPPQPRVISIHDLIMSEGALLISDAYQMSKNILAALKYLSQQGLIMGSFTAKHIACTSTGYKIINVDRCEISDHCQTIVDLRSVGHVMIEMLTRKPPRDGELLTLASPRDSLTDCESFLAIASKRALDLKTFRDHLELLERQLMTWKCQLTQVAQSERLLSLSNLPAENLCSRRP